MTTRFDPRTAPRPWPPAQQTALAVGLTPDDVAAWSGAATVRAEQIGFIAFGALGDALAGSQRSGWIVTPLVGDRFDALDVAHRLAALQFRGALHVLTPPVPRPDVIRHELQQICQGFTVELAPKLRH